MNDHTSFEWSRKVNRKMKITGRQVAAARELLKITQAELAEMAGVGLSTIYRFEQGVLEPRRASIQAIRLALDKEGIEFTNGDSPGVRLRPEKAQSPM